MSESMILARNLSEESERNGSQGLSVGFDSRDPTKMAT